MRVLEDENQQSGREAEPEPEAGSRAGTFEPHEAFDDAIQDYDDLSAMLPNSDTGALGRGAAAKRLCRRWSERVAGLYRVLGLPVVPVARYLTLANRGLLCLMPIAKLKLPLKM